MQIRCRGVILSLIQELILILCLIQDFFYLFIFNNLDLLFLNAVFYFLYWKILVRCNAFTFYIVKSISCSAI
jgi:hypothetical protein